MNKEEKTLDKNNFIEFADEHGIKFLEHEDLSKHTSFKIGGPAEFFVKPKNKEQVSAVVDYCEKNSVPLLPLGKGSNVLVSDSGINGVVMYFGSDFGKIELIDENTIYCEAGAGLAALCNFALENELTGLEFAYGIPGSVGGAVFMNAGAYGGEIKDVIVYADHVDKNGKAGKFTGEELEMSYRHSVYSGKEYFITGAAFKLKKGEKAEIKAKMDDLIGRRFDKQPMDKPSAGSTFKRPEGAFASALIDQCGLKGYRVGGAEVSTKHAGFVVNIGGATCEDVLRLIKDVQEKVKNDTGFFLEPEVEILG
ncbi:MAG: UDP-N-acetylmuramate dehydrogenase [Oscillospiraceae bacterium]|nr:UDP-N-acetylmuramate dehydrogenase [Oscillospiraceae bacterium]MBQ5323090.1 UDP-N-acetylmuramate dehydrogenase [Oscillospiraceae bacterium]MBQ8595465.1 UDP-N-acetylmuramate dehydrogenase [Oscillospiraceae bacterium]